VQLGRRGDVVRPGTVYIAPPEMHMGVSRNGSIVLTEPAKEDLYRPSCDVLLRTAAAAWGPNLVGVILTGMGHDGVAGLAAVRAAGGRTVAQDEATSVVHGMNRRAVEKGLVDQVLPIQDLGATIINLCRSPGTAVPAYCPPRPGRGTVS
jgi:two-component system chemotaxis response regulator CheB